MEEFNREFFKTDKVFKKLFEMIKSNHKVANHTIKVLLKNKHVKDFCEEARHYVELELGGDTPFYIHYDVSSWYDRSKSAIVKIESIGVYNDYLEFEKARLKGLHSTQDSDIPNIN